MTSLNSIDTIDALKISIQCESDMKLFYNKVANLVKSDDAEAILKGLSEKEENNRKRLIKTYSKASGRKILYLNLGKKHKLTTLMKCGEDPNDAVRTVKKNEKELKDFYLTVSRRLIDSELRQLFRDMAMEREQHLALLESSFVEPLTLDQSPEELEDSEYMDEQVSENHTH